MWQAVKDKVKEWKEVRTVKKICGKGYKTPVTERSVGNFVDRQNIDTAMNPRKNCDKARTAKWITDASGS